jgi:DNA polymerase III epsilon subunit-like protein
MENLNNKSVSELKQILKKYDLVNNISSLKKEDLIKTLRAVKKYKETKQVDYSQFTFGDKLVKLDNDQYQVVTADMKSNIRVISAAGSGKSSTVICRIKYLMDKGIDPERILLICFNVEAAESLKNKLIELFGFIPKINVGNIDSIACKFYYRYFKQDFHVGINEYTSYFLKYLQTEDNFISNMYQYVFFDEFHDINMSQFEILRCFYNKGAYITVIGDCSQNIYSFRGSDIKYILNLEQYFDNLKTYKIVNNYRSTAEIINLANYSIKFNTEQIPKEMLPNNPSINFIPTVQYFNDIFVQNDHLIKSILEFHKKGIDFDEIAILCRNNYPLKLLEEAIEKFNKKNNNKIKYVSLINDSSDTKPKIKPNHLTLTTIHKSKGLEWRIVYVIGCNDQHFPSETDKLSVNEERRLFYVASTRAKQYLFYYFAGIKNKAAKLTRFIQELDRKLYNFVNYDKKYYFYDDTRGVKWVNGVTDTIKLLNETDIMFLRDNDILSKENPIVTKLHDKYSFNKYITDYYLQTDFGEFIDRYITRSIGARNDKSNGLIDIPAIIIISAYQFTNEELVIFKKYEVNFKMNMKRINTGTPEFRYMSILNENERKLPYFKKIDVSEKTMINNIVKKLIIASTKYDIDISILINSFSIKNDIPDKFKKKILDSYTRYKDQNYSPNEIKYHIYNVSLCNTILGDRRRLIYKDVYDNFVDNYANLFDDISKYINVLEPEFGELACKKFIKNDEYDLIGEFDLLNVTKCTLIDFKCSSSDKFKLEWMLQLLAYLAIIRKSYGTVIKELEVYNPMQGEIYTIDVSKWDKETEYLLYLYEIRVRQMNRNIDNENNEIVVYPIKYDNKVEEENNEKNLPFMDYVDDTEQYIINPEKEYNLKNIFGDDYRYFLDQLNKQKSTLIHYDIIDRYNQYSVNKYIVIDTETTGLPEKQSNGMFYPYTNTNKYNKARMIQICWAVYDNGTLIKLEDYLIKPNGFRIENSHIHGITDKIAQKGHDVKMVLNKLDEAIKDVKYIIGHNIKFDYNIICSELHRVKFQNIIKSINYKKFLCTMERSIPLKVDGYLKPTKLIKLYKFLFNKEFDNQHNAKYDVLATAEVFHELVNRKIIEI